MFDVGEYSMCVNLVLDNGVVWDRRKIDFYSTNRLAYFDEEDTTDLNQSEGKPCIPPEGRYYRVEHNGEIVGELKITPDCNEEDAEEISIAIFNQGHGYATATIRMFLNEFAKKSTIFAIVKSKSPNLTTMRRILTDLGFKEHPRLQDEISNPLQNFVEDYSFSYKSAS